LQIHSLSSVRTDRRKQRRPNRSGPLTRTALHESNAYNSPVFRFRQVANWHAMDRPPALLRDEASHDHDRWRWAPMVRACGSGRRGYNNSPTNPAGSFRVCHYPPRNYVPIPLIAATTTKKVFWSAANSIATLIPKLYRSPMRNVHPQHNLVGGGRRGNIDLGTTGPVRGCRISSLILLRPRARSHGQFSVRREIYFRLR
jgi:hypothetical protein